MSGYKIQNLTDTVFKKVLKKQQNFSETPHKSMVLWN